MQTKAIWWDPWARSKPVNTHIWLSIYVVRTNHGIKKINRLSIISNNIINLTENSWSCHSNNLRFNASRFRLTLVTLIIKRFSNRIILVTVIYQTVKKRTFTIQNWIEFDRLALSQYIAEYEKLNLRYVLIMWFFSI